MVFPRSLWLALVVAPSVLLAPTYALPAARTTTSSSLADVCTVSHVKASLPSTDFGEGIHFDHSSITAAPVYNVSIDYDQEWFPGTASLSYCNVTLAYGHEAKNDTVHLMIYLPEPSSYSHRWLSTGGGGFAINSGNNSLPGGLIYGAAAGSTDGGFGGFDVQLDDVFPLVNGTANLDALYSFGYQAIHELSIIGHALTKTFYDDSDKVYSYYQGCSEVGLFF